MKFAAFCLCLFVLSLAACTGDLLGEDVIAQANQGGQVSFDVVKIDDAVLHTVLAQRRPAFDERFKKYLPPADLKIAIGDTVSVVIWESASDGLFGESLAQFSFPAGSLAKMATGQAPATSSGLATPPGMTDSTDVLDLLLGGGSAAQNAAADQTTLGANPPTSIVAGTHAISGYDVLQQAAAGGAGAGVNVVGGSPGSSGGPQQSDSGSASPSPKRLDQLMQVAVETGRPGTRIPDQQVGVDGAISIPYAGRIEVADHSPEEVQRKIEQLLAGKALDPQALVVVKRSTVNTVSVAGEVIRGARVPLSPGGDRLLQVIAAAGGSKAALHDTFVRLSRGGVTATVPLATLVSDPDQDIYVQPGDVLTLVRRQQTYSVFGATGRNSAITFNSDHLSMSSALAKAGGLLDERADPRAVFLFRYEPVSLVGALGQPVATGAHDGLSPVVYRLDLSDPKSYLLAQRFPVHDKDVLFVANAKSVPVYKFFTALSQVTGPVQSGLVVCSYTTC